MSMSVKQRPDKELPVLRTLSSYQSILPASTCESPDCATPAPSFATSSSGSSS